MKKLIVTCRNFEKSPKNRNFAVEIETRALQRQVVTVLSDFGAQTEGLVMIRILCDVTDFRVSSFWRFEVSYSLYLHDQVASSWTA
jgi:hypothetical protein